MKTKVTSVVALSVGLVVGHLSSTQKLGTSEIPPEITLPAKVVAIYDGDTVTCNFSILANVRMLDNWSKEMSEEGGKESRENLIKNCPIGSDVMVKIPIKDNISKSFTFGRILGRVYKDGNDLSELQVSEGFSSKNKVKNNGR